METMGGVIPGCVPGCRVHLSPFHLFLGGGSIRVRMDPSGDSEQKELQSSQCSILVSQQ